MTSAERLAPLIAIVGSDGSGKSTLARDVLARVRERHPAEICYLGLGSGELGNRIKRFPFGGVLAERFLAKRAGQARDKDAKIPGLGTALVIYGYSLIRRRRFRRTLELRRKGVVVITDRYPQTDVAGFYDGPGLSAARAESGAVRRLVAKERRIYDWMASHVPDLVVRLNVDVETAMARKPDHARHLIERKVEATSKLRFNGAPIVDLDAREPYPLVLEKTLAAVGGVLARQPAIP